MKLEILKMAFESLLANKTRSILSMLGIIIGVSTVIAVFAIGQGAQNAVDEQFQNLSANSIIVMGMRGRSSTASSKLSISDAKVILERAEHINRSTGSISGNSTVNYGTESGTFSVVGTDISYFDISNMEAENGRFYTEDEVNSKARLALLGSGVVETLYQEGENSIGTTITISGKKLEVIGTVKEIGSSLGPLRPDDSIFIPNTTAEASILGSNGSVILNVQADSVDNVEIATEELVSVLRSEHGLRADQEDDFRIMDAGSMVGAAQESAQLMTVLLTMVAAITLLVSGIGIMNVMFVTVAERTKEIGIAKAIGGKQGDILLQFLLESMILSTIGGLVGIAIGQAAIPIISNLNIMTLAASVTGPVLGFSFSVLVGVFFGFYPAFKASRLDPVDALRSE